MKAAAIVFRKELVDALRDRRTLLTVLLSSVAVVPALMVVLSFLVAGFEQRAESREVFVAGIEHAPSLRNFIERQAWVVKPPPADYQQQLVNRSFGDAVVVVSPGFEAELARGSAPVVEVFSTSANTRAQVGLGRVMQMLQGFVQEQVQLRLAFRGVAPGLLQPLRLESRDLADTRARAAQSMAMLPFAVLMAMLYGALGAALDSTAGERERGSLEPLLMNPAPRAALVIGKWGAVAVVGILIAVLSSLSFLPAQALLRSETLSTLFQFGLREALLFIVLLAPLGALLSAVLMAVAIGCRSFKEAQATTAIVVLVVSLLPLVLLLNQEGEQPWHLGVPALAQMTLTARVLNGQAIGTADVLGPLLVAAVGTALCLAYVARRLRGAAVR